MGGRTIAADHGETLLRFSRENTCDLRARSRYRLEKRVSDGTRTRGLQGHNLAL